MHTLASRISDEIDLYALDEPPVRRMWCDECRKRTAYRYDAFDLPVCLEHAEDVQEV